jgi:thiamine biosynthesis protein ThiI
MPAGTAGRLVGLISAGFDSPVAAYRMIRRGASVALIHFYGSAARPGESSCLTVTELASKLTEYQLNTRLYFCHFEPIQREIVLRTPSELRVLLYRRMMLRIAAALARRIHAHGLITGDSLAQVASQTVRNLEAVNAAVDLPVYRPLIGSDKVEIVAEARRLGTFDYSSENPHDCCSAFMPRSPALAASPEDLDQAEARLNVAHLVESGLASLELRRLRYSAGKVIETAPDAVSNSIVA